VTGPGYFSDAVCTAGGFQNSTHDGSDFPGFPEGPALLWQAGALAEHLLALFPRHRAAADRLGKKIIGYGLDLLTPLGRSITKAMEATRTSRLSCGTAGKARIFWASPDLSGKPA
jgi:hypothetical protein